jgi:hypothetical protein
MYPATTVIGVRNSCTDSDSRRGHFASSFGGIGIRAFSTSGDPSVEGSEISVALE